MLRAHWLLIISLAVSSSSKNPFPSGHSLTLPLHQHKLSRSLQKRKTVSQIGLGDNLDMYDFFHLRTSPSHYIHAEYTRLKYR